MSLGDTSDPDEEVDGSNRRQRGGTADAARRDLNVRKRFGGSTGRTRARMFASLSDGNELSAFATARTFIAWSSSSQHMSHNNKGSLLNSHRAIAYLSNIAASIAMGAALSQPLGR